MTILKIVFKYINYKMAISLYLKEYYPFNDNFYLAMLKYHSNLAKGLMCHFLKRNVLFIV